MANTKALGLSLGCLVILVLSPLSGAGTIEPRGNILSHLKASWDRLASMGTALVKPADHLNIEGLDSAGGEPSDDGDDFADADDATVHAHWALLVAGSNGWGNYRHQSDVCHAYQVLRKGGYQASRIVIMVYNDIASNNMNPFPGQIFNSPGGANVYEGIVPDYFGEDVTAETFLAVLAGDVQAVQGKGNGKVIQSGPNDRVFVFYSDHGATGILGMPAGSFLYADDLMKTIKAKRHAKGFKEMVLYIEACESGSMFEGLLDADLGVYAVSASNSEESSWGTYCPGADASQADIMGTCLGDLFSVAWMENAEETDLTNETLLIQFFLVRMRTSNNFTYVMGSHAMQFGALKIQRERAGDYEGTQNKGVVPEVQTLASASGDSARGDSAPRRHHAVGQRDADLEHLRHAYTHAKDGAEKARAKAVLDRELARRKAVDDAVHRAASHLLRRPLSSHTLMTALGVTASQLFRRIEQGSSLASLDNAFLPHPSVVSLLVSQPLGLRPKGLAAVDSWDCLRAMVQQWELRCGAMDQYAMKHTRFFANLCNAGLGAADLGAALGGSDCRGGQQQVVPAS